MERPLSGHGKIKRRHRPRESPFPCTSLAAVLTAPHRLDAAPFRCRPAPAGKAVHVLRSRSGASPGLTTRRWVIFEHTVPSDGR